MSSFMSRFGLNKKTSESPAVPKNASNNNNTSVNNSMVGGNALSSISFVNNNTGSRNYASAGPIKANTQIGG